MIQKRKWKQTERCIAMKVQMIVMVFLFLASSSLAAEITENEVDAFMERWFYAQNKG